MKISLNELRKIVRQTIAEAQTDQVMYDRAQGLGGPRDAGYVDGVGYMNADGTIGRNRVDPRDMASPRITSKGFYTDSAGDAGKYDYEIEQGLGSAEAGGYMDGLGYFDPRRNSFVAGKALRNDVDPALANVDLTDDSGYGKMAGRAAVGRGTAKTEHEHVIDVDVLYGIPGTIQSGRGRSRETFYLDKNDPALREISKFGSAGYADPKEVLRILIKYDLVPATATMNTVAAKMGRMEQSFAELVD